MSGNRATFVLVGHCRPDISMLRSAISRVATAATIVTANDEPSLQQHLGPNCILLVNRTLDGDFDDAGGLELISRVLRQSLPPVAALISNYSEAQEEAVAIGAVRGFGKSSLYAPQTAELIRRLAAGTPGQSPPS